MKKVIQKKLLHGKRELEIFEDKQVKVYFSTLTNIAEETISIYDLDEHYDRVLYRDLKWIIASVLSLIVSLKFFFDAISLMELFPVRPGMGFFLLALIFLGIYLYRHQDQIVFKFYKTEQPAIVFWNNKPDIQTFKGFIDELVTLIKKTRTNPNLTINDKLDIYLEQLSFLVDENVLSPDEAEKIFIRTKNRLEKKSNNNVVKLVKPQNSNKSL